MKRAWANVPGVVYPEDVARARAAAQEAAREAAAPAVHGNAVRAERRAAPGGMARVVPGWAVTTAEAAEMLGCGPCQATALLRAERCGRVEVSTGRRGGFMVCWARATVERLAKRRAAARVLPPGYVLVDEASAMTGLKFRRLQALARACRLRATRVLVRSASGAVTWRWAFCKEALEEVSTLGIQGKGGAA